MLWKTAEGKVVEIRNLADSHLISIARMVRNKTILSAKEDTEGTTNRPRAIQEWFQDSRELEEDWCAVIEAVTHVLKSRDVKIPQDLEMNRFAGYAVSGTPDLKIPGIGAAPFDPQNPKFKNKVKILREERKPPKPRTRDILDY